jgi:hypothetical protein
LGVKKAKISFQSPKTEFGAQNQYGRVTYPSIGNFTWSMKKYTFGVQKGENKASEPKNGAGPKISKQKDKNKKAFQKMHAKKVFVGLKRKKQARNLR